MRGAALFVAVLAGMGTAPAVAQTVERLVSNIGRTESNDLLLVKAQQFTTGTNAAGYTLSSVTVKAGISVAGFEASNTYVAIHGDSSGAPGTRIVALNTPASIVANTRVTFAAPAGTTLEQERQYWVIVNNGLDAPKPTWSYTNTGREDSGALPGWSIGDGARGQQTDATWGSPSTKHLMMELRGYANGDRPEPLTATLSQLESVTDEAGKVRYAMELKLSEDTWMPWREMRDHAFVVEGGAVVSAKRQRTHPRYKTIDGRIRQVTDKWTVQVMPDTPSGAVEVTLPGSRACYEDGALCSLAGGRLGEDVTLTLKPELPPLTVSIADTVGSEKNGVLRFTITLSKATRSTTVVWVRTTDGGTATEMVDYSPSGDEMVTIMKGVTSTVIGVGLMDDNVDDDGETVIMEITDAYETNGFTGVRKPVAIADKTATGTITSNALTARVAEVPAGHDGSNPFELRIAFDAPITAGQFRFPQAFDVTNGEVVRTQRVNRRSDLWRVRVEPDGFDDVTVVLRGNRPCGSGGVPCAKTEDREGRIPLSHDLSITVRGWPAISVADAEATEGPGATMAFQVSLDKPALNTITVDYATRDGTAGAGADYTATSGTLTFGVGESTTQTVRVAIRNDAHDDDGETFDLVLSNPSGARIADGTATGTIENSDAMPRVWMARFGRTVADQVLEAVDARMGAAQAPGVEATVAGQRLSSGPSSRDADALAERDRQTRAGALAAWLHGTDGEEDRAALSGTRAVSGRELFAGTSFALTGGSAEGGTVSAWGRGAVSRFDGREDELALDGEVGNLMLGADFTRGRASAGLMRSHARGSGGYRGASSGTIEADLTGLYPWGRYAVSERVSVWGVAGYGEGTLTLEPEGQAALETGMDLAMASVGVRGVLVEAPPEGGAELAVTSDAMAVRTTSDAVSGDTGNLAASEAEVTRLRLGLEGSRAFRFAGGASLVPSVELGVRHDGGDAETGFGADIGAGLAWSDPARGLSAEMRARGLLTHEDGSFSERGFAGSLAWDPAPESARGPSMSIARTVGAHASGGVEALFGAGTETVLGAANENDGNEMERRALEAKLGYGFALFHDRYTGTPELGLGLTDGARELVVGWRLAEETRTGLAFGLDVEAAREESAGGEAGHRLGLGFGWRLEGAEAQAFELRLEGSRLEPANDDGAEHRFGATLTARW